MKSWFNFVTATLLGMVFGLVVSSSALAQSIGQTDIPIATSAAGKTAELLQATPRPKRSKKAEPFGANLFRGGFGGEREDGLNPNYIISPGDQINLRIWGAVETNNMVTVDPQGNIFVPGVGPVTVGGTLNKNLNDKVTAAVRTVYTDNVSVYTSLNSTQPVAVFVTGFVVNPGRYAGIPSNSALHFLDRAGGIDPEKGSYRDIRVLRNSKVIASVDLYDFLLEGRIENVQFTDGDTIVVGQRGNVVSVSGDVNNPAMFEFLDSVVPGASIAKAVLLKPGVTYVGVSGIRDAEPFSVYLPFAEFGQMKLQDGDQLAFRSDMHDQVIVVDIEGSFDGPSRFAVPRNTRLPELLDYIPVDIELTDTVSVSIKRLSIQERQQASLENSLRRLESQYLTASSQTDGEAAIRAQEAKMISEFVQRARNVEPNGRLVVSRNEQVADVILQNGDVVTIPPKSDSVLLSGEVLVAQAMLFEPGVKARTYIQRSGGFSNQADEKRIVLVHANGEVTTDANPMVRAGDEIIVLPKIHVKNLQIASVIVDIMYKIAVAASVAVKL